MDDQRRPGSPHNQSPPPCQAHHGNNTAIDGHNEADRLFKRARVDAIGVHCNDLPSLLPVSPPPPLSPSYNRSTTRSRGLLMRSLYFYYVLCFCIFSVAKALSSSQSSTLFAIMSDFGYHPLLADTWKGNNPCEDKWFGILCDVEGVKYIFLMSMNLTGTISPRFADLTSLHGIDLSDNLLTGTIPHELIKMKLRVLDVSYNQLHGKISRFGALVLATDGNQGIVMASIVRVPLESVVGFFFGILVLGFLFIGGAGVLFYLAKKVNHHI
ncbi:receptor-like kinase TMK2 [Raphanus sativus]|nr:receptor-like kinase TMK2 [Raphanus sativus]KAJ4897673.1 receptor-like kinase TMK2 [Raphanus sativus]